MASFYFKLQPFDSRVLHSDSGGGESVEDAAGSHGSEKASGRASSDVKGRAQQNRQTTSTAPATSEGQSPGSQSRQSGGPAQGEAEVETEVEADPEAGPESAEISKDDSEEEKPTPVVKDSLTAISGPAKRRLPMLCQVKHLLCITNTKFVAFQLCCSCLSMLQIQESCTMLSRLPMNSRHASCAHQAFVFYFRSYKMQAGRLLFAAIRKGKFLKS